METTRLRWFLALAEKGGVRDAAAVLRVTPGALSKAMKDLEAQVGQPLFVRSKKGVLLTEAGGYLRLRAAELLRVEDEIKDELSPRGRIKRLAVVGTEPLLALHFVSVLREARTRFPDLSLELRVAHDDAEAHKALRDDPTSLAILAETSRAQVARPLPAAKFGTFVGTKHALARRADDGVPVAEVIAKAFVVPERAIFGPMVDGASTDGWRDDLFPRAQRLVAPTLALVQAYVESGHAVAYIPVALARRMDAKRLVVTGCPYSCEVAAHLVRSPSAPGWVRQLV